MLPFTENFPRLPRQKQRVSCVPYHVDDCLVCAISICHFIQQIFEEFWRILGWQHSTTRLASPSCSINTLYTSPKAWIQHGGSFSQTHPTNSHVKMQKPNQEIKFCVKHFDNTKGAKERRILYVCITRVITFLVISLAFVHLLPWFPSR